MRRVDCTLGRNREGGATTVSVVLATRSPFNTPTWAATPACVAGLDFQLPPTKN